MKCSKISLRCIVGFVLSCAFLASGAQQYSGTVVDQATEDPVEGVLVSVGYSEYYTRTDANGRFTINLPTTSIGSVLSASNNAPTKARWNFGKRTLDLRSAPGVNSVSIYTINGKRVFGGKVPRSRVLEVPSLAKGTYLLELRGEHGLRGKARVVVSNQATASVVFGSTTFSGDNTRLSKSAQVSATPAKLIFRHDDYYPKDEDTPSANMNVQLEADPRSFVFDQSKIREYRFTLSKEDSTTLDTEGWREKFVRADLKFVHGEDGESEDVGEVGLRYKGSNYSLPRCFFPNGDTTKPVDKCPKISYKIKFTEYDKDKRFYKMKKLCLHAMKQDPTKMHDMLAYELFREMGIPASRTSYANVYVNDRLMGLFVVVEEPDGRFTDSRWRGPGRGNGNLYKEVWPKSADAGYYVDGGWDGDGSGLKTNEENPNTQRMVEYYNAIATSTKENFAQKLAPFMDFDYFLRYLATEVAINHWDGARTWYSDATGQQWSNNHNYYFYEEENADGKIWIIPWDMDQTFWAWDYPTYLDPIYGEGNVPNWNVPTSNCGPRKVKNDYITAPNCDPLFKLTASVFGNRYAQLGNQFLNDQFQSQRLSAKIDKYSALIDKAEMRNPGTWGTDKYVKELKESLPKRANKLRNDLENQ